MAKVSRGSQTTRNLSGHLAKPTHKRHATLLQSWRINILRLPRNTKGHRRQPHTQQILKTTSSITKQALLMQKINYIKHLKGVFIQFSKDNRLNPTHISLYVGLFQIWNNNRFPDEFYINRNEVMSFSKIGSKSTYHKCIRELDLYKYLCYYPSHNPFKGSKIKMFNFETSSKLVSDTYRPKSGQALVSYTNNNKQIQNKHKLDQPKNEKIVIAFFKKEKWPEIEAKKFYNHYQGIGWKVGGKTKIVDWKATAKNWILKSEEILSVRAQSRTNQKPVNQNQDNLKTTTNKNYNDPL